jgi:hypothetical protein
LNADGGYCGATIPCEQGHAAQFVDYREKKLLTVLALQRNLCFDICFGQFFTSM